MTTKLNTQDTEGAGSGMSGALGATAASEDEEIKKNQLGSPVGSSTAPATIGGSSATQTSTPVKAMPKQQKAGTGTFANLKSYLQAAQGGGQQKVAQAATQQVQKLGTGAQRATQQAQNTFGSQLKAGSGAIFEGLEKGQYLTAEKAAEQAAARTADIIGAARGVTYQAPQQPAQAEEKQEQPAQAPAQQYFTPTQQEQFADIINAQYQGPQSLQQAGLYEPAAQRARTAEQAGQLTQTALGREQLLRDVFGRGSRDYSRGASKLDALLLNASEQSVQQLQQQAQPALQAQQSLQAAQNLSANEAANRAADIAKIRSTARGEFTTAREEEENIAKDRIAQIQKDWNELPDYFKNVLTQAQTQNPTVIGTLPKYRHNDYDFLRKVGSTAGNLYNLSSEEAAILGLTPGQGLFGVTPESIRASEVATGAELITKDQLSRQLALAQLAGLDLSKGLQKTLEYTDLEKAGTKDILSSLDTQYLKDLATKGRQDFESAINNLGMAQLPGSDLYYRDIMKEGGYYPISEQPLVAEDYTGQVLKDLAEGKATGVEPKTSAAKGYLQNIYEKLAPIRGETSLERIFPVVKSNLAKYGGLDTVQTVDNEQTKARSEALRTLLGRIYKNE